MSESYEPAEQDVVTEPEAQNVDIDSMGKDKRRQVIGETYGPTVRKQLTVYGIFIAVLAALTIGFLTVVNGVDNREMPLDDTAPWSAEDVEAREPGNIDFPLGKSANQGVFPTEEELRSVKP